MMYRRPKFLEVLLQIREQMARDADYDVDRFAEMVRSGSHNGRPGIPLVDETGLTDNSASAKGRRTPVAKRRS
jgi:hypothetical protein